MVPKTQKHYSIVNLKKKMLMKKSLESMTF